MSQRSQIHAAAVRRVCLTESYLHAAAVQRVFLTMPCVSHRCHRYSYAHNAH